MARDDQADKEFSQLEREIEAKVDSLFVEIEEVGATTPMGEEDPWKNLKEHFLTLEWEIDGPVLEKISEEVRKLQTRFPDGSTATLLGWMGQMAERIRGQGKDVDQETMRVLHQVKDELLLLAEDPFRDPAPILRDLRPKMERMLVGEEEEAPTITLDAVGKDEDLFLEDLDRTVEEALQPEDEEPSLEEEFPEPPGAGPEEAREVMEQEELLEEWEEEGEAPPPWAEPKAFAEEKPEVKPTAPPQVEAGTPEGETDDFDRLKELLAAAGKDLEEMSGTLGSTRDPLGLADAIQSMTNRAQEFSSRLSLFVNALQGHIQALQGLDLAPRQAVVPPEPVPEPVETREEVLFVSVSNRVFGIPLAAVRGVFRVPSRAVPQVVQMNEVKIGRAHV